MKKNTLLIIDDHTLVRETWRLILDQHPAFTVVGEAGTAAQGIELAKKLRPAVVIMDINLPDSSGIEATRAIRKELPSARVLAVSLHTHPAYARRMIREGAQGYLTKNSSREEMFTALLEILGGKKYICREIKNILSEQLLGGGETSVAGELSKREKEIVSLIRQGHSSKQIAAALSISIKTVEVHRFNILRKLNLRNNAALLDFIHANKLAFV